MKSEEFKGKEFSIAVAVGFGLERADFVVDSFKFGGGELEVVVGQEAGTVAGERFGDFVEDAHAGGEGAVDPVLEEGGGQSLVGLIPELGNLLAQVVGGGEGLVEREGLVQTLGFVASRVEV